jgi:hypothetical protein
MEYRGLMIYSEGCSCKVEEIFCNASKIKRFRTRGAVRQHGKEL